MKIHDSRHKFLGLGVVVLNFLILSITISRLVFASTTQKTLKVGIYENKPKEYLDSGGNARGLFPDILHYIAGKENWKLEYVEGTFDEGLMRLAKGEINLMVDVALSEERLKEFDFTNETVFNSWAIVFVPENSKISSFKDLDGKKIAILKSSIYASGPEGVEAHLSTFGFKAQIIYVNEQSQVFDLLSKNQVDAGVVSRIFALTNKMDYPGIKETGIYFSPTELRFALHKDAPDNKYLIEKLDFWVKWLKEGHDGVYAGILQRNGLGGVTTTKEVLPPWFNIAALVIAGVLIWLVFHIYFLRRARTAIIKKLGESEEYNKSLVQATDRSGIGTVVLQNVDGKEAAIVSVNDTASRISGYSRDELLKMSLKDVLPLTVLGEILKRYKARQEGQEVPQYYETAFLRKDGISVPIMVSPAIIKLNGQDSTVVYFTDISELKKAQDEVQKSEEKFRSIFEKSPLGIAILSRDLRFVSVNQKLCKMAGITEKDFKNLSISDITPPEFLKKNAEGARQLLEGKISEFKVEEYYVHKNGEHIWSLIGVNIVKDPKGDFLYFLATFDDITEKKKDEETLKKNISLLDSVINSTADGLLVIGSNGKVEEYNEEFQKLWKIPEKIIRTENDKALLTYVMAELKEPKEFLRKVKYLYEHPQETSLDTINFKDGRIFERYSRPQKMDGKIVGRVWSFRDITRREKTEKSLGQQTANLKAIFESMDEGVAVVDMDRRILMVNPKAEKIAGWKAKEVIGKNIFDMTIEDESGKLIPKNKRPLSITLRTGKPVSINSAAINVNGKKIYLGIISSPIIVKGKMIGGMIVFRDIGHEKEVERAKSEFVSIASHQLRTPLGISKWYLEALKADNLVKKDPGAAGRYIEVIEEDNERLIKLINDLLNVSRIEESRVHDTPVITDVNTIVNEVVEKLGKIADKKKISLKFNDKTGGKIKIKIDKERFKEVIECLLSNSIKYSNPKSVVTIILKTGRGQIMFSVTDHGIGINKADRSKIFSKFFRSSEAARMDSEGSGLGLFVAKSYVEGWGGHIGFDSTPGKETRFYFYLPFKKA